MARPSAIHILSLPIVDSHRLNSLHRSIEVNNDAMNRPLVAVHGGAGGHTDELREHAAQCREAIESALGAAAEALEAGGGAVEAVQVAVIVMEAFPLFNAGCGAALCSDGSVELSAAVMRGSDSAAGGVAMMRRTRHPVAAAAALLDEPEVLLVGDPADAFAASARPRAGRSGRVRHREAAPAPRRPSRE